MDFHLIILISYQSIYVIGVRLRLAHSFEKQLDVAEKIILKNPNRIRTLARIIQQNR